MPVEKHEAGLTDDIILGHKTEIEPAVIAVVTVVAHQEIAFLGYDYFFHIVSSPIIGNLENSVGEAAGKRFDVGWELSGKLVVRLKWLLGGTRYDLTIQIKPSACHAHTITGHAYDAAGHDEIVIGVKKHDYIPL